MELKARLTPIEVKQIVLDHIAAKYPDTIKTLGVPVVRYLDSGEYYASEYDEMWIEISFEAN